MTIKVIIASRVHHQKTFQECVEQLRVNRGNSANYEFAQIHAQHANDDTAIAYLKKPVMQRDPGFIFIRKDPLLDPIRIDRRFKEIISSMDFPG